MVLSEEAIKQEQIQRIQSMFLPDDLYYIMDESIVSTHAKILTGSRYVSGEKLCQIVCKRLSASPLSKIPQNAGRLCSLFSNMINASDFVRKATGAVISTNSEIEIDWIVRTFELLNELSQHNQTIEMSYSMRLEFCQRIERSIYWKERSDLYRIVRSPSQIELDFITSTLKLKERFSDEFWISFGKIIVAGILHTSKVQSDREKVLEQCSRAFLSAVVDLVEEKDAQKKKRYISYIRAVRQVFTRVFGGEHFKSNIGVYLYAAAFETHEKGMISRYNRFLSDFYSTIAT